VVNVCGSETQVFAACSAPEAPYDISFELIGGLNDFVLSLVLSNYPWQSLVIELARAYHSDSTTVDRQDHCHFLLSNICVLVSFPWEVLDAKRLESWCSRRFIDRYYFLDSFSKFLEPGFEDFNLHCRNN